MDRAKWYRWHSWVGLKLSVLMSFILITGTLAVFSHELDWLTNSAKRVDSSTVTEVNWAAIYDSAQRHYGDRNYQNIRAPRDPWYSAELVYIIEDDERRRAFFHPTTGEFLGEGRWFNWQRFFRMSHRHLMMPTIIGVSIVGILAVLLFVSFISSFYIYPKWWKGFFRKPRTHHPKVFWGDMHRLLGVWSQWFILVISITGIWYLVERWGGAASYPSKGKAVSEVALNKPTNPSVKLFNRMLEQTKAEFPELEVTNIRFPARAGQGVSFTGSAEAMLVRPRANLVSFDPVTGELLTKYKAVDFSLHARISEAADPLHFGYFGGMVSKVIYFVFGVALSALALSGVYIFGMKVSGKPKEPLAASKHYWRGALAKMKWGKRISYGLIMICLVLTLVLFTGLI